MKKAITLSAALLAIISIALIAVVGWWWLGARAVSPTDVLPASTVAYLHQPTSVLQSLVQQHTGPLTISNNENLLAIALLQDGDNTSIIEFYTSDPLVDKKNGDYGAFEVQPSDAALLNENASFKNKLQPWYNMPNDTRSWAYVAANNLQQSIGNTNVISKLLPAYKQSGLVIEVSDQRFQLITSSASTTTWLPLQQVFPLHSQGIGQWGVVNPGLWLQRIDPNSNLEATVTTKVADLFKQAVSARYDVLPLLEKDVIVQYVMQDGKQVPLLIASNTKKELIDRMHKAVFEQLPKGTIVERQLDNFTARYLQGSTDDVATQASTINGYAVTITANPQTGEGLCTARRSGHTIISTNQNVCLQYVKQLKGRPVFQPQGVVAAGTILPTFSNTLPKTLQVVADELLALQISNQPFSWSLSSNQSQQVLTFTSDPSITVPQQPATSASGDTLTGATVPTAS